MKNRKFKVWANDYWNKLRVAEFIEGDNMFEVAKQYAKSEIIPLGFAGISTSKNPKQFAQINCNPNLLISIYEVIEN
mgnify:CR=1 FL=1|tara:strand:+ start:151 stop:381 length:231 start_codon:yes stop_codon:yes gene_type:complete